MTSPRLCKAALSLLFCVAVTGCRHKIRPAQPLPVPPTTSVPVDHAPDPAAVASVPVTPAPTASKQPPRKAPKLKKKAAPAPAPAPVMVAAATPPPAPGASIGALSAGGEDMPAQRQKAADLIAQVEKRVANLPTGTLQTQKKQVQQVKSFVEEARKALAGGDAEGSTSLSNKAKVLLDDLK